ncbi:transmembrane protein 104 homolog [Penaeus indicus]|uniref:transmembrane protein 104 homolog n=1 Tax=Penaeus indicus TaxID=29960 RepID=UPI00300D741A
MPSSPGLQPGEQYSSVTGLIYVFNLIVGTGCLTLPAAFAATGWALSTGGIVLLAVVSYMTATWVVESMACANAINHCRRMKQLKKRGQVADELVSRTLENAEADQRSTDTSEDHDDHDEELPLITDGLKLKTTSNVSLVGILGGVGSAFASRLTPEGFLVSQKPQGNIVSPEE